MKICDSLNDLFVFQPFIEKQVSMTHLDLVLGSPYIELETCLSLLVIYCQSANISRKGNLHAIYEIIRHIFEGTITDPQHFLIFPFTFDTSILYIVFILTFSLYSFPFLTGQFVNHFAWCCILTLYKYHKMKWNENEIIFFNIFCHFKMKFAAEKLLEYCDGSTYLPPPPWDRRMLSYILLFLCSWDQAEGRRGEELIFMVVTREKHSWKIVIPWKMSYACLFFQRRDNLYIDVQCCRYG